MIKIVELECSRTGKKALAVKDPKFKSVSTIITQAEGVGGFGWHETGTTFTVDSLGLKRLVEYAPEGGE
jgi:hypothetical protein